jgi:hypothetical protein
MRIAPKRRRVAVSADEQEFQLVRGSFASWKLDAVDAIMSDVTLQASDKVIAVVLLQHLSGKTWRIFPSQEIIGEITHMTARNVRNCLSRLRAAGWLRWERGRERKANEYEFVGGKIATEVSRMKAEKEARKARKDRNHSSSPQSERTGTTVPVEEEAEFRLTPEDNQGWTDDGFEQEDAA